MNPAYAAEAILEVLEGPLEGSSVPLLEPELSIGREPGNQVVLLDGGVSRRHCVIRRTGTAYQLEDLGSRNATLINGHAVKLHELQEGDQIRIGKSLIRFHRRGGSAPTVMNATRDLGASSIILRAEDARYLRAAALPAQDNVVRDLSTLLTISRSINSAATADALYRQILESVLEATSADRGAILLGDSADTLEPVCCLDRARGLVEAEQLSRTVLRHVATERVALITSDVSSDEALQSAQSLIIRHVKSVLAVPMEAFQRLLGVLYLESASAPFPPDLLELIAAVGSIAGLAIEKSHRIDLLAEENQRLLSEMDFNHDMVGQSAAMKQVIDAVARAARTEATVLISGESGTGKELVARAVHRNSNRRDMPFIAINCAAIPENLLESELFGHEKGAFTGAVAQKKGKLELAAGGTVFLDEIGEMAPLLQGKLLRVLQEREMERVGGTRPIKLDIRLIAATNRDLREESKANRFRADLYYRLNVVAIRVPALRERREDIPSLAAHFAKRYSETVKRPVTGISRRAMSILVRYEWPGNVRELENAIERAVVMGSGEEILPEDLPDTLLEQPTEPSEEGGGRLYDALRDAKRQIIEKAMAEAGGLQTKAAQLLDVHPNHLSRLMRSLDMKKGKR